MGVKGMISHPRKAINHLVMGVFVYTIRVCSAEKCTVQPASSPSSKGGIVQLETLLVKVFISDVLLPIFY